MPSAAKDIRLGMDAHGDREAPPWSSMLKSTARAAGGVTIPAAGTATVSTAKSTRL
jgi:hypothetical protein